MTPPPKRSIVLLTAALLLSTITFLTVTDVIGLVAIQTVFDRPHLMGAIALILLGLSVVVSITAQNGRLVAGIITALAAVGWLGIGLLSSIGQMILSGPIEELPPPQGRSPYTIRVLQSRDVIDTVVNLRLRQEAGLFTHEWALGCFNDDDPADRFDTVRWTGPHSLAIRVGDSRIFPVVLDPSTGEPDTVPELGGC